MYVTLSGTCFIDGKNAGFGKVQLACRGVQASQMVLVTFRGTVDKDMPEVVFGIELDIRELQRALKCAE